MKFIFLCLSLLAVVCAASYREPKSFFYGLRRIPRFNRRFIPSRFYPNLYYSPIWFPRGHRVYRSTGKEEPQEVPDTISEPEKRSIRKKLAKLPKWKADIILRLFGQAEFNLEEGFQKLGDLPLLSHPNFDDRSLEVEDILDEVLTPEADVEALEESLDVQIALEESLKDLADDEVEDSEMLGEVIEELNDELDDELVEGSPIVKRETTEVGEEGQMTETIIVKMPEDVSSSNRRRRRRRSVKVEETEDNSEENSKDQPEKRSAQSPYLIEEDIEDASQGDDESMYELRKRRNSPLEESDVETLFTFEEESTREGDDLDSQPQKRSVYGAASESVASVASRSVRVGRPAYSGRSRSLARESVQRTAVPSQRRTETVIEQRTSLPTRGDGYSR